MTNIRLCCGDKADRPYLFKNVCINVYSIEEICYLFALNPFMITNDIINNELIDWIDDSLNLKELASFLRMAKKRGASVSEFVSTIMKYVGFCDDDELKEIEHALKNCSGLTEIERRMQQADYLLQNGRIEAAIEDYEEVLSALPDVENVIKPKIYRNMGCAYAKMFMFDIAGRYLKRAYDLAPSDELGIMYLTALRIYYSNERYLNYISEHSEWNNISLKVEKKIDRIMGDFEGSQESIMLNALNIYKDEGNVSSYYEEIDRVIAGMKDDYIKSLS